MSKITGLFIFAIGVAVGSAVTWRYTKKIYEQRAQEEIDSVKEVFSKKSADKTGANVEETETTQEDWSGDEENVDISQYKKILENEGYATDDKAFTVESGPYVISPDEFGEFDDYDQISLTYYADQVLADENDEMIQDADNVIGAESLTHFGEYEDDSVYVRNDRLNCDYEILKDERTYSEILKQRPHRREG